MRQNAKSIASRVLRNLRLVFSAKAFAGLAGLFYLALAGRSLGADQFGKLVLLHALVIAIREIASFKSWQVLISYGAGYLESGGFGRLRSLIRLCLLLDLLGAIIAALLGVLAVSLFGELVGLTEETHGLAIAYCLSSMLALRSAPVGVLRLYDRFDQLARHALVVPILRSVGVIVCWFLEADLEWFVCVWLATDISSSSVLVYMGYREWHRHPEVIAADVGEELPGSEKRALWKFVWWAYAQATVTALTNHLPLILSGGIVGSAAAGYVKVCQEVAAAIGKLVQVLSDVIYPELARLSSRRSLVEFRRTVTRVTALSLSFAVPVVSVLVWISQPLLRTLFGPEFEVAATLLSLLFVAAGIQATLFILEPALYTLTRVRDAFQARAVATGVQIVLILVLSGSIGINAVGYSAMVYASLSGLLMSLFVFAFLQKHS